MEIDIPITSQEVDRVQRPEGILNQILSVGTPSEKRARKNMISLREKVKAGRSWLTRKKGMIEAAKKLVLRTERRL